MSALTAEPVTLWTDTRWRILDDGSIQFTRYPGDSWNPIDPPSPALVELARYKVAEHEAGKATGDWAERAVAEWFKDPGCGRPYEERLAAIMRRNAPEMPAPGAMVCSKTQLREDGSVRTTHYLCGDQRATRERAQLDLLAWRNLRNVHGSAMTWMAAAERLPRAGFLPNLEGLDALLAERRALWEALSTVLGDSESSSHDAAFAVLESSWLADPANREGGAK